MLMLQYTFKLPADYSMTKVRQRVAQRGHTFDDYPGLIWKAFLVRERGTVYTQDNQYAPLYLWADAQAAMDFLVGPLFSGVTDAFGWTPAVQQLVFVHQIGPAGNDRPLWCTQRSCTVDRHADLRTLARHDSEVQHGMHSRWVALDPSRWTATIYELWTKRPVMSLRHALLYEIAYFATQTEDPTPSYAPYLSTHSGNNSLPS